MLNPLGNRAKNKFVSILRAAIDMVKCQLSRRIQIEGCWGLLWASGDTRRGQEEVGAFPTVCNAAPAARAVSLRKALFPPSLCGAGIVLVLLPSCRWRHDLGFEAGGLPVGFQAAHRALQKTHPPHLPSASSWGKNFSVAPPGSGDLFNKQIWLLST